MEEIKDRRSFDRPIVPGITALMINASWYYLLKYKLFHSFVLFLLGKNLIQNLSASGSCILSKNNFEPGKAIYLFLSSPGGMTIFIKGTVRWISFDAGNNMYCAGIQFRAYGNGKRYNSFKALEQLHIYTLPPAILV